MLILLSGTSGVGKNTLINELVKRDEFNYLKNYTTRAPRPYEIGAKKSPYHFVTREEFERKIANGEFYEFEYCHGNIYGTLQKSIDEIGHSKEHYLKDIGVEGAQNLKKAFGNNTKVITIFLTAPVEVLKQRLIGRGEKDIDLRLSRMEYENSFIDKYDYVINNIEINETIEKILEIVKNNENNNKK